VPDIYDIDFKDAGANLTPVKKRKPIRLGFLYSLLEPLIYLRTNLFDDFIKGANRPEHTAGVEYLVGQKVNYRTQGVYECIVEHIATANLNTLYFKKIQDSKFGVNQRLNISDRKIVLEAYLNRILSYSAVVGSPIVIIRENSKYNGFWIGVNGNTSYIGTQFNCNQYIGTDYSGDTIINFTVQIDVAQYNALSPIAGQREKILRSLIDPYLSAGFVYAIDVV
jgi:hypothetical protein